MGNVLERILNKWPRSFIRDVDLARLLDKTDNARHALVKRALGAKSLIRLRKGLYLIANKHKGVLPNEFELSLHIYQPSYVSLESALSYHGWIPEAVYTTTCVSSKRAQEFTTPLGMFSYKRIPEQGFYMGVERVATAAGVFLIADPWKALADFMYTRKKSWSSLKALEADLRIDTSTAMSSDITLLKTLSERYPSPRVRRQLILFLLEITSL